MPRNGLEVGIVLLGVYLLLFSGAMAESRGRTLNYDRQQVRSAVRTWRATGVGLLIFYVIIRLSV